MSNIDNYLRSQVSEVSRMVVNLDRAVGAVSQQVAIVGQEQQAARSDLAALRDDFNTYVRQAELAANLQRAETRLGALKGELEFEFGHHKIVRRSAVGMLQAFDIGLVSEETIRVIGEELMVQTPRYWLAPVLVALAAWSSDDEDLCRRAVDEAFRRSPSRTSLFMALVLRRQGRQPSSVRWLKHYLDAQDPTRLGRDFAVILESISQGAFGPAGLEIVQRYLDRWRELLLNDEAVKDAQVERWRAELNTHISPTSNPRFPRLAAVCPQWLQLDRVLAAAESQRSVLDRYHAMIGEEFTPTDRLEDAVDDILDRLVDEYDDEELPLRRELAFNEAVIRYNGDVDVSTKVLAADAASMETTLDYLTIQTTSALNPAAIGVSRSTQRLAVAACHEWFARAHAVFARDYRMAVPTSVEAVFESTHNTAARSFQLPRWVGSFQQPIGSLERSLGDHWDHHSAAFVQSLAFDKKRWIWPILAAALGLLLISVCTQSIAIGLTIAFVGGGIWALVVMTQQQAAQRRQEEARGYLARAKQDSITQLRAARAELTDWEQLYRAADALEGPVRQMIMTLPTLGHAPLPYERRGVTGHHASFNNHNDGSFG